MFGQEEASIQEKEARQEFAKKMYKLLTSIETKMMESQCQTVDKSESNLLFTHN